MQAARGIDGKSDQARDYSHETILPEALVPATVLPEALAKETVSPEALAKETVLPEALR